jgi:hypothetical protein
MILLKVGNCSIVAKDTAIEFQFTLIKNSRHLEDLHPVRTQSHIKPSTPLK